MRRFQLGRDFRLTHVVSGGLLSARDLDRGAGVGIDTTEHRQFGVAWEQTVLTPVERAVMAALLGR